MAAIASRATRATRGPILPPLPPAKLTPPPAVPPTADPANKPVIIRAPKTTKTSHPPRGDKQAGKPAGKGALRPTAARIVALAAVVATLLGALAAATPAGSGIGLNSAFQAYANAMPWTPPPTPTPPPPSIPNPNPGRQAILDDIQAVFGPYSPGALNISSCESGYDPNAWNPILVLNSHAEGVFQILYPSTWNSTSYRNYSPYNSWANIRAAYEIFKRDGYTWREWECRP
jgi:hypothetical protein